MYDSLTARPVPTGIFWYPISAYFVISAVVVAAVGTDTSALTDFPETLETVMLEVVPSGVVMLAYDASRIVPSPEAVPRRANPFELLTVICTFSPRTMEPFWVTTAGLAVAALTVTVEQYVVGV